MTWLVLDDDSRFDYLTRLFMCVVRHIDSFEWLDPSRPKLPLLAIADDLLADIFIHMDDVCRLDSA